MPELRWTLLIVGVVFVVALAWWERRRPHQASRRSSHEGGELRSAEKDGISSWDLDRDRDSSWDLGDDRPPARVLREPTLTLPEIRVREPSPARDLPIVEIGYDETPGGLPIARRVESVDATLDTRTVEAIRATENADIIESMDEEPVEAEPLDADAADAELQETTRLAHELNEDLAESRGGLQELREDPQDWREDLENRSEALKSRSEALEDTDADEVARDRGIVQDRDAAWGREAAQDRGEALQEPPPSSSEVAGHESPSGTAQAAVSHEIAQGPQPGSLEPIVEWPPDETRKIVALRVIAPQSERFAGRALRRALAAEGFVLGKFAIFHKPDLQNRAFLSAASLNKPGTFDLETIDIQRFSGLNLFAVLPGPKAPRTAFEELLITARSLNERLQGTLQDDRGTPLTAARISALREGLGAEAGV